MKTLEKNECPINNILQILTGPWTTHILWLLKCNGTMRFGELKNQIEGISSKVLTQRLKFLAGENIIFRKIESPKPLKVIYGLTQKGHELSSVCKSLNELALTWKNVTVLEENNG